MHANHRMAASALVACLWSAGAAAQALGLDASFNGQMNAARQRADESLPFLVDNPEVLRVLQSKIWRGRQAVDDGVNRPPVCQPYAIVRVSPGMPEPVNEINTIYGIPTSVTFIDVTGAPWPIQWEFKTNEYVKPAAASAATSGSDNQEQRRENNQDQPDPLYGHEAQRIANVVTAHGFMSRFRTPDPAATR